MTFYKQVPWVLSFVVPSYQVTHLTSGLELRTKTVNVRLTVNVNVPSPKSLRVLKKFGV